MSTNKINTARLQNLTVVTLFIVCLTRPVKSCSCFVGIKLQESATLYKIFSDVMVFTIGKKCLKSDFNEVLFVLESRDLQCKNIKSRLYAF